MLSILFTRPSAQLISVCSTIPIALRNRGKPAAVSLLLTVFASTVIAAPLPADLSTGGAISFDDFSAFVVEGPRTTAPTGMNSGDFGVTGGGATSLSTFSTTAAGGPIVTGANPQGAPFSDTGDGLGASIDWASHSEGFDPSEQGGGFDFSMGLENTSLTESLDIDLILTYSFEVGAPGVDSFSSSSFSLEFDATEVFYADLFSDNIFGDELDYTGGPADPSLGTFGDLVTLAGTFAFTVTVPLSTTSFLDGALTIEGGAFDGGALGASSFFLSFAEPVNTPATLILFAVGIVPLLLRWKRKQSANS